MMRIQTALAALALAAAAAVTAAACSDAEERGALAGVSRDEAGAGAVELTGNVIEIQMISGRGELFEPSELVARRGDVLRFVLGAGVHNVSFPEAKNPKGVSLPETSPYLQLPGQVHEVTVDMPAGSYVFECVPHVPLGMVGTLTIVD